MRMTMMTSIMSGSWTWGRNFSWPLTLATSWLAAQILTLITSNCEEAFIHKLELEKTR